MSDQGRIDGRTKLIGLTATPIGHSLSPAMHNMSFRKLGLNYVYMAFEVDNEQLADVVTGFRALNLRGYNVSMPNKTVIHKYLDKLSPAAELIGAVNTVVNDDGVLTGHNTDGVGFMRSLTEENVDVVGKKMTLIGTGGAGTAIAVQAALDGVAELSIFNRKDKFFGPGEKMVEKLNETTSCKTQLFDLADEEQLRKELADSTVLVDSTSVGMNPLEGQSNITDLSMVKKDLVVADTVYIPKKTKLLELVESKGCHIINGLGMMLWQGAKAFEIWTGEQMPVEYVKEQLF